jgi:hypothetical protein
MKWLLPLAFALFLGACSTLSNLERAATSSVTPTQAIVAANAFDAAESGATAFLTYCKSTPADATCVPANRRAVIKYVRAGRAARNQMETYIQTSASVPSAVYNTVVAAMDNLKATPAAKYVGAR